MNIIKIGHKQREMEGHGPAKPLDPSGFAWENPPMGSCNWMHSKRNKIEE